MSAPLSWPDLPQGWYVHQGYQSTKGSIAFKNDANPGPFFQYPALAMAKPYWKLHLNVPDNRNDPGVQQIVQYLLTQNDLKEFKVGVGDDEFLRNGNQPIESGMTVYAGSRDAALALAQDLSQKFPSILRPTARGNCRAEDQYVQPGICMRFSTGSHCFPTRQVGAKQFTQFCDKYGAAGITPVTIDINEVIKFRALPRNQMAFPFETNPQERSHTESLARNTMKLMIDDFGDYFLGQDATQKYRAAGNDPQALPQWAQDWLNLEWRKLNQPAQQAVSASPRTQWPWTGKHPKSSVPPSRHGAPADAPWADKTPGGMSPEGASFWTQRAQSVPNPDNWTEQVSAPVKPKPGGALPLK